MKSINSVLKPCPFCGGKAVLFVESGVQVICLSCGVRTSSKADMICQKKEHHKKAQLQVLLNK